MKEFKWRELLTNHSIFGGVATKEVERIIDQLLDQKVSAERQYAKGTIIVREGELGDSVFFVGSGFVEVLLPGRENLETCVAVLKQGEFFGEMALIEKKPRTATVRAVEDSILLEINGQEFLKLLDEHRDVESKMLLKLSERLRHANDEIVAVKFKSVDEKLKLFNEKVDAELKKFGAFVTEAGAMANQTKSRADDIISSFERTRTWMTWIVSFITVVLTLGGLVGGGIGYLTIENAIKHITDLSDKAEQNLKKVTTLLVSAQSDADQIKNFNTEIAKIRSEISDKLVMPLFESALKKNDINEAVKAFETLQAVQPQLKLFSPLYAIRLAIIENKETPRDYTEILFKILQSAKKADDVTQAYYLLLMNAILVGKKNLPYDKTFDSTFSAFKQYVKDHKDQINKNEDFSFIKIKEDIFSRNYRIKLKEFLSYVDSQISSP